MKLTKEQIKKINDGLYGQGVCENLKDVYELRGCYVAGKSGVVYNVYETGGKSGGHYDGSKAEAYKVDERPKFIALVRVLKALYPSLSFLDFQEIEGMIEHTSRSDGGDYYGNSSEYRIDYISLDKLYEFLEELANEKQN